MVTVIWSRLAVVAIGPPLVVVAGPARRRCHAGCGAGAPRAGRSSPPSTRGSRRATRSASRSGSGSRWLRRIVDRRRPRDQPGSLQHLEVLRDRRLRHRERRAQVAHRQVALGEAGEDRAAGGIGEGAEDGAQLVGHRFGRRLHNQTVIDCGMEPCGRAPVKPLRHPSLARVRYGGVDMSAWFATRLHQTG